VIGGSAIVVAGLCGGQASAAFADAPDPSVSPALTAWLDTSTTDTTSASASAVAAQAPADSQATTASAPTKGARLVHKHGGVLLWTANTLEWYWNSSKITSSSGSQSFGYIFPNTASKGGITRTLKTSSQHDWRGTMYVGAGVVTPWGDVDVYTQAVTDYYELVRGGKDYINP
jgi:hypothetical protein